MMSWNREKALRQGYRDAKAGEIRSVLRGQSKRSLRDMLAEAVANTAALTPPDEDEVAK
jgi:hypothetical protein